MIVKQQKGNSETVKAIVIVEQQEGNGDCEDSKRAIVILEAAIVEQQEGNSDYEDSNDCKGSKRAMAIVKTVAIVEAARGQ